MKPWTPPNANAYAQYANSTAFRASATASASATACGIAFGSRKRKFAHILDGLR